MMNKVALLVFFASSMLLNFNLRAEQIVTKITAEQWAIPRHGERILSFPEIKKVMQEWQKNTEQSIEISYPGGENGELWLTELKDWLIALGVASVKIKTIAGSGSKDLIKLTVMKAGGISE